MRDCRHWVSGVLLWLWMVYKTFLCFHVSCTNEIKTIWGWEFWENFCISFLTYLHLRGKGPYIQSAHKTGARRKAVPEMCFFLRVENSWATVSIFIKRCGTELEAGKRMWSWMKTYHFRFKVGDFLIRKWGEQRRLLFQSLSTVLL